MVDGGYDPSANNHTDLHHTGAGYDDGALGRPEYNEMPGLDFSHPGVIENDKDLGLDWIDSNESKRSPRKKRAVSS